VATIDPPGRVLPNQIAAAQTANELLNANRRPQSKRALADQLISSDQPHAHWMCNVRRKPHEHADGDGFR